MSSSWAATILTTEQFHIFLFNNLTTSPCPKVLKPFGSLFSKAKGVDSGFRGFTKEEVKELRRKWKKRRR
jgi:hypothetical protein